MLRSESPVGPTFCGGPAASALESYASLSEPTNILLYYTVLFYTISYYTPDARGDPKSRSPNSGLLYSYGVDYMEPEGGSTFRIRPGVRTMLHYIVLYKIHLPITKKSTANLEARGTEPAGYP